MRDRDGDGDHFHDPLIRLQLPSVHMRPKARMRCYTYCPEADSAICSIRKWHWWNSPQHRDSVSVFTAGEYRHWHHQFTPARAPHPCRQAELASSSAVCVRSSSLCSTTCRLLLAEDFQSLPAYQLENCLLPLGSHAVSQRWREMTDFRLRSRTWGPTHNFPHWLAIKKS